MDVGLLESMVQDGDPEQEMLVVQDELPQLYPESEMGRPRRMAHPLPPFVKVPPRSPAKPRPAEAIWLRRWRLNSADWGKSFYRCWKK